jgi:peptidoglycan/LPS O-acetylase OafA/YrhL
VFGDVSEIGHLGVWIFFALSGFLIIGILSAQRTRMERGGSRFDAELKRFLWRRTLRIFPISYLMLTVMCVLMVIGIAIASPEFALSADDRAAAPSSFNGRPGVIACGRSSGRSRGLTVAHARADPCTRAMA